MDVPREKHAPAARLRAAPNVRLSVARVVGLGLVAICIFAVLRLHASVLAGARHPPSPSEMLLSLVAVATGISGALATVVGPALFRSHSRAPRSGPANIGSIL
jgi:hypothetical protein